MNTSESEQLWKAGKDEWNKWAEDLLKHKVDTDQWRKRSVAVFDRYRFEETADFSGYIFPGETRFEGAIFEGEARFADTTFEGKARFAGATFKGTALFSGTAFKGIAEFSKKVECDEGKEATKKADFLHQAKFNRAKFMEAAHFSEVVFEQHVRFNRSTFRGLAIFDKTKFQEDCIFDESTFEAYTTFHEAIFEEDARFSAIQSNRTFNLGDTEFKTVPDFRQSSFTQAPDLDNLDIKWPPDGICYKLYFLFRGTPGEKTTDRRGDDSVIDKSAKMSGAVKCFPLSAKEFEGPAGLPDRCRTLKRLASQSHNRHSEAQFLRRELIAQRAVEWSDHRATNLLHLKYWTGIFYQVCSNFGLSLWRPFVWWLMLLIVFAAIYYCSIELYSSSTVSGVYWTKLCKMLLFSLGHSLPGLSEYAEQAVPLSSRKSFPEWISFLRILQTVLSSVLVFLFALAVRNHFRIR